jgi:peptide/nickel transport system substrate-binding protein
MHANYWTRILARRMSRRRTIAVMGSTAAASAFLAACGSDSNDSRGSGGGGGGSSSGIVAKPVDTTKSATRDGILKDYVTSESQTLDPSSPVAPLNQVIKYTYGALLTEEPGHLAASPGKVRGDMAEKWEVSPDKLTMTLKLRPGVTFHNKAPVNGRAVTMEDVVFSWERYAKLSPFAQLAFNGASPDAPILSFTPTDSSTIVVKLKEPLSYALKFFGIYGSQSGNMMIMPKEADGGFDPRHDIIGHGPFAMTQATPSVGYTFKRHDGYYDKDWALLAQVDAPIVPEYASRVAQFKTGNIYRLYGNTDPLSEDVTTIKRDNPNAGVYQTDLYAVPWIMVFGQKPDGQSPFTDERVRQAVSMGIDRDAWINALFNVDGFERDGLPVESSWNSHLLAIWQNPQYWLDPQGKDFGDNAKYFKYNPEEAKALLKAAGHGDGMKITSHYPVERLKLDPYAEPIDGMMRNLGIDITIDTPDYATQYIPQYRDGHGQYEGWLYCSVTGVMPQAIDPVGALAAEYWEKGGAAFRGFSKDGSNGMSGDPELSAMIVKARQEFDQDKLKSQLWDIQRYLGKAMWGLSMPGGATGFDMMWPALGNAQVWRMQQSVAPNWDAYQLWIDKTKPPLA